MSVRGTSAESFNDQTKQPTAASSRLALYRKYRPSSLDDVVGQPQVTDILKSAAKKRSFAHAYLFTGQRGTGKTSVARILAHLINDTKYGSEDFDIIEIDAASRGSVDDARELRDKSFIAPVSSSHKIYIIDEVHMLSTSAFNALLKIIEEPPEHVVFILATTEIQKVPATILSRVQRFHFHPVAASVIAGHLRTISDKETIQADDEALQLIAERGGGSFRDSISLLDQLSGSEAPITREVIEDILGLAPEDQINNIIDAITNHDAATVISVLSALYDYGINATLITEQTIAKLMPLAIEKPKLYNLINSLLDVNKSSAPNIKLLAVMSMAAAKTTSVATLTTVNKEDTVLETIIKNNISKENSKKTVPVVVSDPKDAPAEIVWQDILNELKNLDQPAILATLKSANIEYSEGTLTLYFDRSFHRTKADMPKYRESLQNVCHNIYGVNLAINVAKTAQRAADSKNSLVAEVAAIMGGGDIVKETASGKA